MSELKDKTIKGIAWNAIKKFSVKGIQFIITLFLARLLMPSDYGMLSMVYVFSAVAQTIVSSGFSQALTRKTNRTELDNCTIFYFNISAGIIMYGVLFLISPYVEDFYNMPGLCNVMRATTFIVVIGSFSVVQSTLCDIELDFKTPAKAAFISIIISGPAAILVAYLGYGVWALVTQIVLNDLIYVTCIWIMKKWRPKLIFSITSLKSMFGFGSKLLASGLLNTIYENIYSIVIGKIYDAKTLGFYSRANQFANLPSSNISGMISSVVYPALCTIQNDLERLRRTYRIFLKLSAYIIFPLMCGLAALAHPMTTVLIGEKWAFSADLLQIICFSIMWYPVHSINLNLLQVAGRSDLFLKLEIIKKIYGIAILCITAPLGIIAMCWGGIVGCFIGLGINTYYTGKLIDIGFFKQMKDLMPTFIMSLTMFIATKFIVSFISSDIISLAVGIIFGTIYYIAGSYIFKFYEFQELLNIIKNLRKAI